MAMGKGSLQGGSIYRRFTSYPRCKIFSCPKLRGVSYKCCYFCEKREKCNDKCMNDPSRCGMCMIPEQEEGKTITIPDHPDIRKMELYGTLEQNEEDEPTCPVCHEECERIYMDAEGNALGCENCVTWQDSAEYWEGKKD